MKTEARRRLAEPLFENPGQGGNPNIALTRSQNMSPLTLVGS